MQMTSRQLIEHQTRHTNCQACHSRINPTGAVFSNFNPLGIKESQERRFDSSGRLIRSLESKTSALVPWLDSENMVRVSDARQLNERLAKSQRAKDCFGRLSLSFF
jgi:hypothetical protein